MANFIEEIDRLSCMHRAEAFPHSCVSHAKKMETCIENDLTPEGIRYAFFKITSTCNSNCAYCEHAFSRNKDKNEISLSDLQAIIKQLSELGVTSCSLSGGEPLVYKHLNKAVELMKGNGIEPILLTNGILLPDKMPQLYESGLRYVIMSLDSFEAEHYRKTRGIDFASVMRSYKYMVQFKDEHKDIIFRITTVISKENIDDIVPLFNKANNDGVGVQFTPYHNFINKDNDIGVQDIEKIKQLTKQLLDFKQKGKLICNSENYISYFPVFFETKSRIPKNYECKCGYNAVYIWPNLDVRSCWSTSLPSMGNLKDKSLSEIWGSAQYNIQRRKMLSCECEGCWLLCTAEFNIIHTDYLQDKLGE